MSQSLGIYADPSAGSPNYSTDWDAIKSIIPYTTFMMSPLDSTVVNHIGTDVQWCLIPAGMNETNFVTYGLPCWQTGHVQGFVLVDEPGSDGGSVALIQSISAYVHAHCTGTNNSGQTVKTAVTQYDGPTLAALAADNLVDTLIIDCYPSRTSWNMSAWDGCVAACDAALVAGQISSYWIVLDAFTDGTANYPLPTQAQLMSQIAAAQGTNAERLVTYAYGNAGAVGTQLQNQAGLLTALNTIPSSAKVSSASPALLDNFTRANGALTGTYWAFPAWPGYNQPAIASNALSGVSTPSAYWTQTLASPYSVSMKLISNPNNVQLYLVASGMNSSLNGYYADIESGGGCSVGIVTGGTETLLSSATFTGPYAALQVSNGNIGIYQSTDGISWTLLTSAVDNTYTSGFQAGFAANGTPTLGNFGGGYIYVAPSNTPSWLFNTKLNINLNP